MNTIPNLQPRQKRRNLIERLRQQIISGEFPPGTPFPTYETLEKTVGTSRSTLQYAIGQLQQTGYLQGFERRNIMVPEHLPCHSRFALLFETHESDNKFWTKLETASHFTREPLSVRTFRNISDAENTERHILEEALYSLEIGGCIFTFLPEGEWAGGLVEDRRIPKVIFSNRDWKNNESVINLLFDFDALTRMAAEEFLRRGVKRAAVIAMGKQRGESTFTAAAEKLGLEVPPYLIHAIPDNYRENAANLMELLAHLPPESRPQGVFVNDENLLEHLMRGLVTVPPEKRQGIEIISHANFPEKNVLPLPALRIGFDAEKMVRNSCEALAEWHRSGKREPILATPQWENEIR